MSYQYPPPPPAGYAPPPPQQGHGAPQPGYQQPPQQGGWVDNRQVIGGWSASQYGMQTGKHIEYKVFQKPTQKGGVWKTVTFFKPYQKKNGQQGEGRDFSFNQMKELVERINHFQNTYGEEKGYFVWQPSGPSMGVGNPNPYGAPPVQAPPAPQYGLPPPQYGHQAPPPAYGAPPAPQPGYQQPAAPPPPPPGQGGGPWP